MKKIIFALIISCNLVTFSYAGQSQQMICSTSNGIGFTHLDSKFLSRMAEIGTHCTGASFSNKYYQNGIQGLLKLGWKVTSISHEIHTSIEHKRAAEGTVMFILTK